jgi:pSer/pThr/pTyr-binding forkhead associated (FHA) protein
MDLDHAEVTIGRRGSRDIRVDIDLGEFTGDRAVSHHHARLVRTPRGTYDLIDVGSTNGTRLNGASSPVPPNTPVELGDGDRVHVGGWTTITIRAVTR